MIFAHQNYGNRILVEGERSSMENKKKTSTSLSIEKNDLTSYMYMYHVKLYPKRV